MSGEADRERIIRTVAGQLESELLLGGWWLPIGSLESAGEGAAQSAEAPARSEPKQRPKRGKMPSKRESGVVAEKRKRLEGIAKAVGECEKCPLRKGCRRVVPGEGNPDGRIAFIGEAPGESEDLQGRPFVGRAGQLLTKIIKAMGFEREEVFIGNILKCRPPGNRDPQASEVTACQDYLFEQLEIIEPEVIVALGAHAARVLLGSTASIGDLRGRVHACELRPLAPPIKLVATYHPAYLLRSYTVENRKRVWQDMQMVLGLISDAAHCEKTEI